MLENHPEYPKMFNIWNMDPETKRRTIDQGWTHPEFEYLANTDWIATEKIDGTNVRVMWDGEKVKYHGRTNNAQMPVVLTDALDRYFQREEVLSYFRESCSAPMTIYGEGFGGKIQNGSKYGDVQFAAFDVRIGDWWLRQDDAERLCTALDIPVAPRFVRPRTLFDWASSASEPITSQFGDFQSEGLVVRPAVDLFTRNGTRIIVKLKTKDLSRD